MSSGPCEQTKFYLDHPGRGFRWLQDRPEYVFVPALLALALAIYLPNLGTSLFSLDLLAYEPVLHAHDYLGTTIQLFSDFKGAVVPGYYAPLSSVSLMLDKVLAGSDVPAPRMTVLINLLFHCINGLFLYLLLRRFRTGMWPVLIATYLFLVHPIQVSSVLWFAERKTLMACTLYLLSYLFYIDYRQTALRKYYGLSLLAFGAALLSKPTAVVLPVLLLAGELLGMHRDVNQPSGNVEERSQSPKRNGNGGLPHDRPRQALRVRLQSIMREAAVPLLPYLALSLIVSVATVMTEGSRSVSLPILDRPFVAAGAVWFYLFKILVPFGYMPLHPRWTVDIWESYWSCLLALLFLSIWLVYRYRAAIGSRILWALAGFLIALLPAIGIVGFGWLRLSYVGDHLIYLSMTGIAYCIGLVIERVYYVPGYFIKYVLVVLVICFLGLLPIQAFRQARMWSDPVELWTYNLSKDPLSLTARGMLGAAYGDAGRFREAEEHLRRAIEINPEKAEGTLYAGLGGTLLKQGKAAEAVPLLRKAVEMNPRLSGAHSDLGEALLRLGNITEAENLFKKAIKIQPFNAGAYNNLGNLRLSQNRTEEAIDLFRQAIQIRADAAEAYNNLGAALMRLNRVREADDNFKRAVELKPQFAQAHANRGMSASRLGNTDQAIHHLQKALDLEASLILAHLHLGRALEAKGQVREAARQYSEAVRLQPEAPWAHYHLAEALLKLGDARSAISAFEKVIALNLTDYQLHNRVGEILLSISEHARAVEYFRKALEIKPDFAEAARNLQKTVGKEDAVRSIE